MRLLWSCTVPILLWALHTRASDAAALYRRSATRASALSSLLWGLPLWAVGQCSSVGTHDATARHTIVWYIKLLLWGGLCGHWHRVVWVTATLFATLSVWHSGHIVFGYVCWLLTSDGGDCAAKCIVGSAWNCGAWPMLCGANGVSRILRAKLSLINLLICLYIYIYYCCLSFSSIFFDLHLILIIFFVALC